MSRGATPRSYSRTPSVTRASCLGVGLPSESAGVPSTMIASNRARFVLEAGANWRARVAQAKRPTINAAAATMVRPRQPVPVRRNGVRRCPGLRTGVWLRLLRIDCLPVKRIPSASNVTRRPGLGSRYPQTQIWTTASRDSPPRPRRIGQSHSRACGCGAQSRSQGAGRWAAWMAHPGSPEL